MSISPNSSLVRRTIDLNYANKKRSSSLKWIAVNGLLFLVFVYDLSSKCPGYTTFLHYVEYILAGVFGANLFQHAFRLIPSRDQVVTVTLQQQKLLGLSDSDLDSSFRVVDNSKSESNHSNNQLNMSEALSASLSPNRSWRQSDEVDRPSGCPPRFSSSPQQERLVAKEEFIADQSSLSDYLKQYAEKSQLETSLNTSDGPAWGMQVSPVAPHYQLASLDTAETSKLEEGSPKGSPQVWWRLHLDPQKLTQWNLNLRLWIHVTILQRLVREMDVIDDALAKHGLSDVRIGLVSTDRLRKTASGFAGAIGGVASSLPALLPFLEPFPDQRYLVQRIRDLSHGGCLSNYKWNAGASDWDDAKPTDAEIVMHLIATYLDGQVPSSGNPRPFSSEHISTAPHAPTKGADTLVIHRVSTRPPHYVLALGDDTLEVGRGRNNLLHIWLLFLAAVARRSPPAIRRVHLGRAGLNMLWIIGRDC